MPAVHVPRYIRIREELRRRVREGLYRAGERIPSEPSLAREFGVSRGTVERAIRGLVEEGILVREQGRGTFVAYPELDSIRFRLSTFAEEARRQGWEPSTRLIRAHVIPAPEDVARALDIAPQTPVIEIVRLHCAGNEPIVYEKRQLAQALCPQLLNEDLEHSSLHELLLYKYHIPLVRARFTIHAIALEGEPAALLGVLDGSPGFAVERITYQTNSKPAVRMYQLWRGDRFFFSEEVVAVGGAGLGAERSFSGSG